jgi:hypothetical protein
MPAASARSISSIGSLISQMFKILHFTPAAAHTCETVWLSRSAMQKGLTSNSTVALISSTPLK